MATSAAQIVRMEKELLEYYHKNEDRFKKYSNDIDLLKAKLFESMINDGCFPKRQPKIKRDLTTEYECTKWLSRAAGEQLTFKDFRKMFKSRLKKCELWSEEFYDVCKDIIENRQNFQDCRKQYEEKKAVLSQNNLQCLSTMANNKRNVNTRLHDESTNIDKNISTSNLKNTNVNRFPINIDKNIVIKEMDNRLIPFLRIGNTLKSPIGNFATQEMCKKWVKNKFGNEYDFEDFCNYFDVELSHYQKYTPQWNLVCLKICTEGVDKHYMQPKNEKIQNLQMFFGFLSGYFILGGIAYVFKHLIALAFYWTVYLIWLICNLFGCIYCLLFNSNDYPIFDVTKIIIEPLAIWKIGGLISGMIFILMLVSLIYDIIKKDDSI